MKAVFTKDGVYLANDVKINTNNIALTDAYFYEEGKGFRFCAVAFGAYIKAREVNQLTKQVITGDYTVRELMASEVAQLNLAETLLGEAKKYALKRVVNKEFDDMLRGKV